MKTKTILLLWLVAVMSFAQEMKVPTLADKGVKGNAKTIEWYTYQFVNNQGLSYVKKDVETFDEEGRLETIVSHLVANNQTYKYVYTVDKKGLLTEMKIVNPSNNMALQTTSYNYKKGLVSKITQVQSPNTVERIYEYNDDDHLISVEVKQNGTVQLNEYYEVDGEGRRTKLSRKLPGETEAKVISTYSYETKDGQLLTSEKRNTDQGAFEITKYTDVATGRDILEETKKVSTAQQGHQRQIFEDDQFGSWIKAEVIDEQFGRSRLVIRKISYTDGTETGRTEMKSPDDDRGQFMRKNAQMQLAVNGKLVKNGIAYDIPGSNNRLTYVSADKAWYLLKGYNVSSNMTSWGEAEIITNKPDAVLYTEGYANVGGILVYQNGVNLSEGSTTYSGYSSYEIGSSHVAYIRRETNKTMVVEHPDELNGTVGIGELTGNNYYWGKSSDSTYILAAFGRSVGLQKQLEDADGNKLASSKSGNLFYWYFLPDFRKHFSEGEVGDVFPATYLIDPIKQIRQDDLLNVDFSGFSYDKLANGNYRLKSKDGTAVTGIASKTVKTGDNELLAYFPLTEQYLRMDGFYTLENGKEHLNQSVTVMLDSSANAYYLYNEGQSITFYKPDERFSKYKFNSHKLDNNERVFGAVLYDSAANYSYGMNYDLDGSAIMGPMRPLPLNSGNVYLLKLKANRWVIFEKGEKVSDYDFSKLREEKEVIHFYKDENGKVRAYQFPGFSEVEPGAFIYASHLQDSEVQKLLTELKVDANLTTSNDDKVDLGNLEFSKKDGVFYMTDANGTYVQNHLGWFDSFYTDNLIAYDSSSYFLYELTGYSNSETIEEGKVKVLLNNTQDGVIHWGDNKSLLLVNGELQVDVRRTYITQNSNDVIWKELIYNQSSGETYRFEYKNDTTYKLLPVEKLLKNEDAAYLVKVDDKSFNLITKGELVKDDNAKSYPHQGDLVRFFKTAEGIARAYRFKGFDAAEALDVIPAEIIPENQLKQLAEEISKSRN